FVVKEGIPVELRLRARFIKDGFEITEIDLPAYEPGVVPRPLFIELEPTDAGAEQGSITVISRPDKAEVWLDGNHVEGKTPLPDLRVKGGEMHKVECILKGYRPRWETLFVEPG